MKTKSELLILFFIFVLALLLRIPFLDKFPAGFNPDEASFGYSAYSILKTGKDEWGELLPFALRSFGDFKMPLYSYLATIPIVIFGLSEFSVRLPAALIGALAVFPTFFLTKKLFSSKTIAIFAALFLAISPWHISISRVAFEPSLTIFLFPLGLYFFLVGLQKPNFLVLSSIILGFNLYSGNAARFFTILFIIFLIIWQRQKLLKIQRQALKAGVVFGIFLIPILVTYFSGATSRVSDVGVFNPTDKWKGVSEERYEAVQNGLPDQVARVFNNKATFLFGEFSKNYLGYLSPEFLFRNGPGEANYGMVSGKGVLYIFEIILLPVSLYLLIRKPTWVTPIIFAWLLLGPVPAAFSKGPLNALRAGTLLPLFPILSSFSFVWLIGFLKKNRLGVIGVLGSAIIIVMSSLDFLESYYFHQPKENAKAMAYGWKEAAKVIQKNYGKFDKIVISRSFSEPQIMLAFFTKYDPGEYQKNREAFLEYERRELTFVDQLGNYGFDKYEFRDLQWDIDKKIPDILMVGKGEEFPRNVSGIRTISTPDGKDVFKFVESEVKTND